MAEIDRYTTGSGRQYGEGDVVHNTADLLATIKADAASVKAPTTPVIYNTTMTLADTEYSQALPSGCKRFQIKIRRGVTTEYLRYAFVTGKVATSVAPYGEMPGDGLYFEDGVDLTGVTIYFACSAAARVAEIYAWT